MKEFELPKKYNWELAHEPISNSSSSDSHYLGEEYLGGIIFNLYTGSDGQQHGHVVSLTQTNTSFQDPVSLAGASSSWDGAANTSLYTNSLAKTWVESLGEGWYIPAIDELNQLFNNRYHVNKAISTLGSGTLLSYYTGYWTSTEINASFVRIFNFLSGSAGNDQMKSNSSFLRAVKSF